MTTRTIFSAVFFTAILFVFSSCDRDERVTGVTLNRSTLELTVGSSETLIASVQPANASNRAVTWASSDERVATVSNGTVTAVSPGTATITAATVCGGKTADAVVTVTPAGVGEPTPTTDPGVEINGIVWATRNVDAFGTFAPRPESAGMLFQWNRPAAWSAAGDVSGWDNTTPEGTIWERENDPCPPGWRVPTRWEFTQLVHSAVPRSWTSQNGVNGFIFGTAPDQLFLPASGFRNANGAASGTNEQGRFWSSTHLAASANVNVLWFESTGIWNTSASRAQGFSVRCVEDVSVSVESVSLDRTAMTLPVTGVAFPLVATITPANATDTRITWSSSNEAVAAVSANGVITAAETIGSATITAATVCGLHTAAVAVTTVTPTISDSLDGVVINGIRWATRNVDAPGVFAPTPHSAGMFYQWNRRIGWSSSNPMIDSNGNTTWDNTNAEGTAWYAANDPCPAGWRVPTQQELQSLNSAGSVWLTYSGVRGRLYGTAPNQIFLPAAGWRNATGALLIAGTRGDYWSSTQGGSTSAWFLWFNSGNSSMGNWHRASGLSVRCVAE